MKIQAAHILRALIEADPKNRLPYTAGYDAFLKELDTLDGELKALFAGRKGEPFMVFHPAWGYFAEAYGLQQVPVEIEGKEPKAAQLQSLIRRARERGVKVVFVQPQFSTKSAEMVAREIGGQVVQRRFFGGKLGRQPARSGPKIPCRPAMRAKRCRRRS